MHSLLALLKEKRGAVRTLTLALLVVLAAPTAHAQPTVDGRFDTQILNGAGAGGLDQLRVQLQLQPDQTFSLGSATLMVLFNTDGLALPSNPAPNTELEPGTDYRFLDPFTFDPAQGRFYQSSTMTLFGASDRLSANLVLDVPGLGQPLVAGAFTPIVEVYFDVVDAAQPSSLVWVLPPDPNPVEVFEADNTTAVALGSFANDPGSGMRYVAPGGSDLGNDCTNQASPCVTIAHAVGQAQAGDVIAIAAGSYAEAGLLLAAPMTLRGQGVVVH